MDEFSAYLEKHPKNVSWKKIYHDVPFRTKEQIRSKSDALNRVRRRQVTTLKTISFTWLFVIPSGIAIYVFLAPIWVGLAALLYSIWKAWRSVENIWGYNSRSARENEEAERQRKMSHYFYHCERNPEGFLRLRGENHRADIRDEVRDEAAKIPQWERPQ
jgi:hypothetical protein